MALKYRQHRGGGRGSGCCGGTAACTRSGRQRACWNERDVAEVRLTRGRPRRLTIRRACAGRRKRIARTGYRRGQTGRGLRGQSGKRGRSDRHDHAICSIRKALPFSIFDIPGCRPLHPNRSVEQFVFIEALPGSTAASTARNCPTSAGATLLLKDRANRGLSRRRRAAATPAAALVRQPMVRPPGWRALLSLRRTRGHHRAAEANQVRARTWAGVQRSPP